MRPAIEAGLMVLLEVADPYIRPVLVVFTEEEQNRGMATEYIGPPANWLRKSGKPPSGKILPRKSSCGTQWRTA
jgi:hypothetical protein